MWLYFGTYIASLWSSGNHSPSLSRKQCVLTILLCVSFIVLVTIMENPLLPKPRCSLIIECRLSACLEDAASALDFIAVIAAYLGSSLGVCRGPSSKVSRLSQLASTEVCVFLNFPYSLSSLGFASCSRICSGITDHDRTLVDPIDCPTLWTRTQGLWRT